MDKWFIISHMTWHNDAVVAVIVVHGMIYDIFSAPTQKQQDISAKNVLSLPWFIAGVCCQL